MYREAAADRRFTARVTDLGDGYWQLAVQTHEDGIRELWFPWEADPAPLGRHADDDILYFPHWMGQARKADAQAPAKWEGRIYPGPCFAPLAVIADATQGRIVAAANWPPVKVFVAYAKNRLGLRYDDFLGPHGQRVVSALIGHFEGSQSLGDYPWHRALDAYRRFLTTNMQFEGLAPVEYPEWLREIHGWQNVQLQNFQDHELQRVADNWERFKRWFPWIQMWGQMSDVFPSPGKETGCCLAQSNIHPRYRSLFQSLLPRVKGEGHFGFYTRPRSPYGPLTELTASSVQNRRFLADWVRYNVNDLGVNAHYIDVLGAEYFGEPLSVARLFGLTFPPGVVIEMPVDVYPAAYLISGCLWGGASCETNPRQTPSDLGGGLSCASFPAFGRYLLRDRIFFLGESNGDHTLWGPTRGHEYWTERQAFLLGAKLDAMRLAESDRTPDTLNQAVAAIVHERTRVNWWQREPQYLDRAGVYGVPIGVEVRRFVGKNGEQLLAVDNWNRRAGEFYFLGRRIVLPGERLRILVDP